MSARSFRSVFMVASCAGAALGCYLVSLRVASERAALEEIENEIVLAQRDIRLLQTEIGTRGRLAQLERWNVRVLALSAPSADQFLEGGFALARMIRPVNPAPIEAPVVLASAPAPPPKPAPLEEGERSADGAGATTAQAKLMHVASLKVPERLVAEPRRIDATPAERPGQPAKPKPLAPQASKKAGDKLPSAAPRPMTRKLASAKVDPLAPLPAGASPVTTAKDPGPAR